MTEKFTCFDSRHIREDFRLIRYVGVLTVENIAASIRSLAEVENKPNQLTLTDARLCSFKLTSFQAMQQHESERPTLKLLFAGEPYIVVADDLTLGQLRMYSSARDMGGKTSFKVSKDWQATLDQISISAMILAELESGLVLVFEE